MITKEVALTIPQRTVLHWTGYKDCTRTVGPRGGVTTDVYQVRVTGTCKTWKREPERFRLPVRHGLQRNGAITNENQNYWHLEWDCPLLAEDRPQ